MKTASELKAILKSHSGVDSHVHTHLCDGAADMTVENIGKAAEEKGLGAVVLTPHFHKCVSDESETLYTDTNEDILLSLREEINAFHRHSDVTVLLSTEADIISLDGDTSLTLTQAGERALDLVTPTLNYHPLLPLKFVHLTYGKDCNALHESGEFQEAAEKAGGIPHLLETMYEAEANAIQKCPYPAMLGHFFAAHNLHPDRYSWFGAKEEHLLLMKNECEKLFQILQEKDAMIDLSGIHLKGTVTAEEKADQNGFLTEFQRHAVFLCREMKIPFYFGSDAHKLHKIGSEREYPYTVLLKNC